MGKNWVTYSRKDFLETLGKSAGAAAYLKYIAPLIPIIGASQNCKSPAATEEPKVSLAYRTIEVTYNRRPGPYPNPNDETRPRLYYSLYDPQSEHIDEMGLEYWSSGYRYGYKRMDEFDVNVYKCKLERVLVQTNEFNEPHSSYVSDGKFWEGSESGVETTYTSEGLSIPSAVVIGYCKAGYTMYWKLSP